MSVVPILLHIVLEEFSLCNKLWLSYPCILAMQPNVEYFGYFKLSILLDQVVKVWTTKSISAHVEYNQIKLVQFHVHEHI